MNYRFLGKTGLKISELVLGCQTFGWGADEKTSHLMADIFYDNGGNMFDTADIYNKGASEQILGKWIKGKKDRDSIIIASKVFFPTGPGPNDTGASRKHILSSVEKSLKRLNTDYIDLYQIHCMDLSTPLDETLETLDILVRDGKIRYAAASNYTPSKLQKAIMISETRGLTRFVSLQAEYSLIVRSTEWELLPLCVEEGLGFLAWSPLAGGWLTGKYQKNRPIPYDSRAGRGDRWDDLPEQRASELTWRVIECLNELSKELNKTHSQIALNWLLSRKGVTAPIIGARTPEQLKQNLGSVGWKLPDEALKKLDVASDVILPYPYRFIQRYTRKREYL